MMLSSVVAVIAVVSAFFAAVHATSAESIALTVNSKFDQYFDKLLLTKSVASSGGSDSYKDKDLGYMVVSDYDDNSCSGTLGMSYAVRLGACTMSGDHYQKYFQQVGEENGSLKLTSQKFSDENCDEPAGNKKTIQFANDSCYSGNRLSVVYDYPTYLPSGSVQT